MTRRKLLGLTGLVALCLLAMPIGRLVDLLSLGAAYKAKVLCSSVFIAGRDQADVVGEDLSVEDLWPLRWLPYQVDKAQSSVLVGIPRLASQEAVYRSATGCVLTHGIRPPPTNPLPPSSSRVAAAFAPDQRLEAALDWAFSEPDPPHPRRTRAVVILRDGLVVAERYAPGFGPDTPLAGWSMSKMTLNALVGAALGDGWETRLDQPLDLPEWRRDDRGRITLGEMLRMSSGLEFSEEYGDPLQDVTRMLLLEPDAAAFAAAKPLLSPPGSVWYYASGTTNVLSRWLNTAVGSARYPTFPREALFEPLGMRSAVMEQDAAGNFVASSFMYATARDWAKLGQLYLQDGVWEGRRILPAGWVAYSLTPAPAAPEQEYGAHVWLKLSKAYQSPKAAVMTSDAFHAVGFEGQLMTVIPSRGLVLVRLGLTRSVGAWHQDEFVEKVLTALH
jgi:CubicO group peptidase (beta-lactamase class C family)